MKYRKKSHNTLQELTAIYKRAHRWVMVQPISKVLDVRSGRYVHHGSAY